MLKILKILIQLRVSSHKNDNQQTIPERVLVTKSDSRKLYGTVSNDINTHRHWIAVILINSTQDLKHKQSDTTSDNT